MRFLLTDLDLPGHPRHNRNSALPDRGDGRPILVNQRATPVGSRKSIDLASVLPKDASLIPPGEPADDLRLLFPLVAVAALVAIRQRRDVVNVCCRSIFCVDVLQGGGKVICEVVRGGARVESILIFADLEILAVNNLP